MIKILKIDIPEFRLKHRNGHEFSVVGTYTPEGDYILEPQHGWGDLCVYCQQDVESLYDDIEDVIYSAMPELFER
jgi:hypothetical protein